MSKPSKPSKPSLTDFMAQPEPAPQPAKALKKTEMKHITVRMPPALHRRVLVLTMDRQVKIQAYIMGLIEADFKRQGLPMD